MLIKHLHIENFKSYKVQDIELNNFSIIIGSNAAGKSNIIDAFRFISNIVEYGISDAISLSGGWEYLLNNKIKKNKPLVFEFELVPNNTIEKLYEYSKIVYTFKIKFPKNRNDYNIIEDSLTLVNHITLNNDKNDTMDIPITYKINQSGTGKIKEFISKECKKIIEENSIKVSLEPVINIINNETDKKELILNKMYFIIMFRTSVKNFIKIYDFDSKLLKRSSLITTKNEFEEDGSNMAAILQKILKNKRNKETLINYLKDCLPFVESVSAKTNNDKSVTYSVTENYTNSMFRANFLSDGTVNIIAIIIALYFENNPTVILEEPERNLHPQLMSKVIDMAEESSKKQQIIITTHTPELIKYADINSLFLVQRDKCGFSKIIKPANSERVKIFLENEMGIDELFSSGLLED